MVVVATLHDSLAEITLAAIEAGKHVLVEKPAARNRAELESVMAAAERHDVKVRVGFNHRYHRAFRKARELFDAGALGELMFIRARYGHGGRIGYDKEWRADPGLSGGGELIDQGPHLIDLSRWFLGEIIEIEGFAHTYYWDMPVDDNGFMLLKTAGARSHFCKRVAPNGRTCFPWRYTAAMPNWKSLAWAAATDLSDWRITGCCRRWARPKRRRGNSRWQTIHGRLSSRSSMRIFV